jgi:hypothetical protein
MTMAPVIVVYANVNHFMKECVVKIVGYVTLGAIIVFIGKKTFRNNILPNICTSIFSSIGHCLTLDCSGSTGRFFD